MWNRRRHGLLSFTRAWGYRLSTWVGFSRLYGPVRDVFYLGWWVMFVPRWGVAPEAGYAEAAELLAKIESAIKEFQKKHTSLVERCSEKNRSHHL